MFCTQCGKENREGLSYCIYCGNKLPSTDRAVDGGVGANDTFQTSVKTSNMPLDSYFKMDGWLAVFCYGRLASAVLELIVCIALIIHSVCFEYYLNGNRVFIGLDNFFRAAASVQNTFYDILCYGGMVILFLYLFHLCTCISMCRKIKNKRANYMVFYRWTTLLISLAVIASLGVGFFMVKQNPFILPRTHSPYIMQIMPIAGTAICLFLDRIISLLVFSTYCKTSTRAKVYFGVKQ